jgi:hypothetical protein
MSLSRVKRAFPGRAAMSTPDPKAVIGQAFMMQCKGAFPAPIKELI